MPRHLGRHRGIASRRIRLPDGPYMDRTGCAAVASPRSDSPRFVPAGVHAMRRWWPPPHGRRARPEARRAAGWQRVFWVDQGCRARLRASPSSGTLGWKRTRARPPAAAVPFGAPPTCSGTRAAQDHAAAHTTACPFSRSPWVWTARQADDHCSWRASPQNPRARFEVLATARRVPGLSWP